jgi:hypothetical protein
MLISKPRRGIFEQHPGTFEHAHLDYGSGLKPITPAKRSR